MSWHARQPTRWWSPNEVHHAFERLNIDRRLERLGGILAAEPSEVLSWKWALAQWLIALVVVSSAVFGLLILVGQEPNDALMGFFVSALLCALYPLLAALLIYSVRAGRTLGVVVWALVVTVYLVAALASAMLNAITRARGELTVPELAALLFAVGVVVLVPAVAMMFFGRAYRIRGELERGFILQLVMWEYVRQQKLAIKASDKQKSEQGPPMNVYAILAWVFVLVTPLSILFSLISLEQISRAKKKKPIRGKRLAISAIVATSSLVLVVVIGLLWLQRA